MDAGTAYVIAAGIGAAAVIVAAIITNSRQIPRVTGPIGEAPQSEPELPAAQISNETPPKNMPANRIEWSITAPTEFPNPLRERAITGHRFPLAFRINVREGRRIRIYVRSMTQAVIFMWPEEREIRRWRYGIIPTKEMVSSALDASVTQEVGLTETEFLFNGLYRPIHAVSDFTRTGNVRFEYYVMSPEGKFKTMGPHQIVIPIARS